MSLFTKKKILVTHEGMFHADDIFATAALSILHDGNISVTRTRNPQLIASADIVYDVGAEYNPAKNRFDHHQKGGAGKRENGIPYAAFGLVWRTYGEVVCGSKKVAEKIDAELVQPIDADDNGLEITKNIFTDVSPFTIQNALYAFRPTWNENPEFDKHFFEMVAFAKKLLLRQIKIQIDLMLVEEKIEAIYAATADKRIIVLDKPYPSQNVLENKPEPLFVVKPRHEGTGWNIKAVQKNKFTFENRKDLPASWAGLRDEELQKLTGVSDAVFCHNGRFLAVAKTKEGALKLAELALKA